MSHGHTDWQPVIGLEVHAQLRTRSKLFCSCSTAFGASPNRHTCEVCLGMPGVLPVVNLEAVRFAVRAGLALGCTVHSDSQWSRKNYFYPDLPKGYQISQYDRPIATGGGLTFRHGEGERSVRLTRIHLEEDAGKNVHDDVVAGGRSYVDFNRGGTPLIEIVSEPELRSAAEAADYLRALRQVLRFLDVCDGNMEEGSLRCDANVSIMKRGAEKLGTRVELKNINSFRHIEQAITFEIERQSELLDGRGVVVQETRLWDSETKTTRSMRGKEEAHDYRYFPEPDLPNLTLPRTLVEESRAELPELPAAKRHRYVSALGLSDYDAGVLTDEPMTTRWFEAALAAHGNAKAIANWLCNELLGRLAARRVPLQNRVDAEAEDDSGSQGLVGANTTRPMLLDDLPFGPQSLAELVALIDAQTISGKIGKDLLDELVDKGGTPRALVESRGLTQVSDTSTLEPIVAQVIADNPESVASYKAGKANVLGFFVGQVMKRSGGKANPGLVNQLLKRKLDG